MRPKKPTRKHYKILIVDDSAMMRRLLIRTLSLEAECEFTEAASASEAIKSLAKSVPDLIILDLLLGTEHGFDLLRSLKLTPTTAEIPVVICSAMNTQNIIEQAEEYGAAAFIPKPISAMLLNDTVRAILNPSIPEDQDKW